MYAAEHNLKMLVFNGTTYHDVCQLVKLAESRAKVEYLNKHSLMGIHAAKAVTMADRQET